MKTVDFSDVVVVLGFYVSPTAKVIRRRDLGLKSHPKDWRSPDFSETIEACDQKVGRYRQLNDFMKVCEY